MKIKDIEILNTLVGEFSESQIDNLDENLESYINPNVSLFVPIYKNCDVATMPNHCHPSYSFIYTIKSRGYLVVNGKKVSSNNEMHPFICALSPNIVHQEVSESGFSNYIAIFIDKEYFEKELSTYTTDKLSFEGLCCPPNETLLFILKLLMLEYSKKDNASYKVIESLNILVANTLIRNILDKDSTSLSIGSQAMVDNAIFYMYENIEKKLSVDEIAAQVNVSSSNFSKIFKESTNKAPIEYLSHIRLEKAKRLLKVTDKNLTDIAFDCGFSSSSYFSHCFIESIKLTPSEYRKRFSH